MPNQLVFASGDFATARAARSASRSLFAPFTVTVTNFVAPSPSVAIWRASEMHTVSSAARKASKSLPGALISRFPALPDARMKRESFVDSSPSTTRRLKLRPTASWRARFSIRGETAASVVRKPSIVAILGSIIPEPFDMPPTVTFLPPIVTVAHASFERVSVVIMAFAAARPWVPVRPSALVAAFIPARSLSTGRRRPITPVDATSTWCGSSPSSPAVTSAERRASSSPCSPVHAFAQPELARIACTLPPFTTERS